MRINIRNRERVRQPARQAPGSVIAQVQVPVVRRVISMRSAKVRSAYAGLGGTNPMACKDERAGLPMGTPARLSRRSAPQSRAGAAPLSSR